MCMYVCKYSAAPQHVLLLHVHTTHTGPARRHARHRELRRVSQTHHQSRFAHHHLHCRVIIYIYTVGWVVFWRRCRVGVVWGVSCAVCVGSRVLAAHVHVRIFLFL